MLQLRKCAMTVAAMVCLALGTQGCSLLDPYVRAQQLNDDVGAGAAGVPDSKLPQNQALKDAFTAAAAQRKAYYDAVSTRAKVRNGLPLVLIPLSAAALYKGLSSDGGESTRKLLLKEGLVGASVYGLGTYYTTPGRDPIYLAGAKALSCSIYALTPYYLPDPIAERLSVKRIEEIHRQMAVVAARLQEARVAVQSLAEKDDARVKAKALEARAEQSIESARTVVVRSVDLQALLIDAGPRLRATVESIISEVNAQIAATEPDPAVILTMVGDLANSAKVFAPGVAFARPSPAAEPQTLVPASGKSGTKEVIDALTALAAAVDNLEKRVAALRFDLDVIAQRIKAAPPLDTCKVQNARGGLDVSAEEVVMKVGETRQFVIRSSAGIPRIDWVGVVSADVVMEPPSLAGETMVVQVKYKKLVPGLEHVTLQVSARDAKKLITIHLTPEETVAQKVAMAPAAPRNGNVASTSTTPPLKPPPKLTTAPGPISELSFEDKLGPRNAFERGLTEARIEAMQAKLGVTASRVFDVETRNAIHKWQVDNKQPLPNGLLQSATLDGIMK